MPPAGAPTAPASPTLATGHLRVLGSLLGLRVLGLRLRVQGFGYGSGLGVLGSGSGDSRNAQP